MSREKSKEKIKRRRGRPKSAPTEVVTLRMPEDLADSLQAHAETLGVSRNQACIDLLEQAVKPDIVGSYNPRTGEYDDQ